MSSNLTFYYTPISPPCRAINLLLSYLGIKADKKLVNLVAGEHYKPEFVKMNPHKTVPFIVDGDLYLNQSRAQLAYLVNKYAPESNLYPSDPVKRALVDSALYFDATSLYSSFGAVMGIIRDGLKEINPVLIKKTDTYLELLNNDLKKSKYVAGDHMSIADISLLSSYKSIEATGFWTDLSKYEHIQAWVENLKKELKNSWEEDLEIPTKQYSELIKMKFAANKAAE